MAVRLLGNAGLKLVDLDQKPGPELIFLIIHRSHGRLAIMDHGRVGVADPAEPAQNQNDQQPTNEHARHDDSASDSGCRGWS